MTTHANVSEKDVSLAKMKEPQFLTLTGLPANQVGFKVVRNDTEQEKMTNAASTGHVRRVRTQRRSAVLYLEFPAGTTDQTIMDTAKEYGLDGYTVEDRADGTRCLRRSDSAEATDAVRVTGPNSVVIGMKRADPVEVSAAQQTLDQDKPYIDVVALEFNKCEFASVEAVEEFLRRNDIDFLEGGIQNTDQSFVVRRSEYAQDTETRTVVVQSGVSAVVVRADVQDPNAASPVIAVVNELAYGNYGWGQLDFNASMADAEFSNAADDALYRFRNVVNQILFYSPLPVSVRKELVTRAAGQFATYVNTLLDGLPAQVIMVARSSQETRKEGSMSKADANTAGGQEAQQAATAASAAAAEATVTISRSDLEKMISEAVDARIAATAKPADAPAPGAEGTQVSRSDAVPADMEVVLQRSMAPLVEGMKTLTERLSAIEGSTTVPPSTPDPSTQSTEVKRTDVFAGAVFGRRAKAST